MSESHGQIMGLLREILVLFSRLCFILYLVYLILMNLFCASILIIEVVLSLFYFCLFCNTPQVKGLCVFFSCLLCYYREILSGVFYFPHLPNEE